MTIRKKDEIAEIVIDLTGPDGNAFVLMSYARSYGKQLGWSISERNAFIDEMASGDYEELVTKFDDAFGSFVTLLR